MPLTPDICLMKLNYDNVLSERIKVINNELYSQVHTILDICYIDSTRINTNNVMLNKEILDTYRAAGWKVTSSGGYMRFNVDNYIVNELLGM